MSGPAGVRVVAVTTGTSVDALDVVAADLTDATDTGVLHLRPLGDLAHPMDPDLQARVRAAAAGSATTAAELCALDVDLGRAMADAAAAAVAGPAGGRADLVVLLGQTVHHDVVDGRVTGTLQLGQASVVAERTGLPVVSDLRTRDVAAGGQGAPLVSFADVLLLAGQAGEATRGLLNLGGIANLTVVGPGRAPIAFDAGPANALLDLEVQRSTGQPHDDRGRLAAAGRVHQALLEVLLDDDLLRATPPKSTGKERYDARWLDAALDHAPVSEPADRLATLVEAVAVGVADQVAREGVTRVWASGGGVRNHHLMVRLADRLRAAGCTLGTTRDLGLDPDAKEAYAIAVIGWATWHGLASTVPSCTGASGARILGSITPGADPLQLPAPLASAPRMMQVAGQPADRLAAGS